MISVVLMYLFLLTLVIAINALPALMPATWMIISFFVIRYDLSILPAVVTGALAATIGRIILARLSNSIVRPRLPEKQRDNLTALGTFLTTNKKVSIPLLVSYAFLPIPSNQVFIALGLSGVNYDLIAGSFFAGRLISYGLWVKMADHLAGDLGSMISSGWKSPAAIAGEVAGVLGVCVLMMIPWSKIFKMKVKADDMVG